MIEQIIGVPQLLILYTVNVNGVIVLLAHYIILIRPMPQVEPLMQIVNVNEL